MNICTAGNIISLKRRRMFLLLFITLVFLKLNQELLLIYIVTDHRLNSN